jgi:hypothetical protein
MSGHGITALQLPAFMMHRSLNQFREDTMDVFYRSSPDDSRTRASILPLYQFPRKTEESLDGAASQAERRLPFSIHLIVRVS